jgi:hypothetical protein
VVLVRHYPAYAVALALGSAALAVSVLSGRPFLDAADVALVRGQLDAVPATASADDQGRVRASVADGSPRRVEDAVTAAMGGLAGGGPTQVIRRPVSYLNPLDKATPYVVNPATGERTPGVVFEASGALEGLVPATGSPDPGGTGLWLPDSVATRLHLAAGDPVGLQLAAPGGNPQPATATVTGVYVTDEDGAPEDGSGVWGRIAAELPSWPDHVVPTTSQLPLLVADADTYRGLVAGVGELSLVTWDVQPAANPPRIADLARLNGSLDAMGEELKDPGSELREGIQHRGSNPVTISTGLETMVLETRAGLRATQDGVAAVRVLAAGLSWLVVALAAVALLVRRRGERQVLAEQGRSSLELTALSTVEAVVPVGFGLLVGWWASPPFVSAIVGADGVAPRPLDAALVGGVVLATVGVASATDALARHRRASGRTVITRVPWRSAVLAVAGAGAISAYRGGTGFDAVTAVFPLAAMGAAAIVVSAVATTLLGRLVRRWLPSRLGPRLALSRLARDPTSATAFVAATVAFGAAGYGLLFHASAADATTDKVATAVGAQSVFGVGDPVAAAAVAADTGDSTVVLRTIARVGGHTAGRLYAVDAATFAPAALWSPRFAGRELSELTRELRAGPDLDAVPVVLAGPGEHVPASGVLARGTDFEVPYRVVDRISGFAGSGPIRTILVVDQDALFALAPPGAIDTLQAELWSARDADTVARTARAAGLTFTLEATADEVRADHSALVARSWVTRYLQAFTGLALGIGLLVLAGLQRRDREQRRLQDRTLADLGHPRRLVSRAAGGALSVVALLGAAAGGIAAYAVTASLATRLDPAPTLPPGLVVTGTGQLLVAAVVFAAAALALTLGSAAAEQWLGRSRSVNELLHDE